MRKQLSIVVTVYNGERFIAPCIDSIYRDHPALELFEVVVVNDGSTDGSAAVIAGYASRYPNVKVVEQENRGLSEARNTGIRACGGRYIWCIDQDDWLTEGAVARVCAYGESAGADVIDFAFEYPDGRPSAQANKAVEGRVYSGSAYLDLHLVESPVWHYIVKRSFLLEHGLFYYPVIHEDTLYTPVLLFTAATVVYWSDSNYVYNFRENSLSTSLAALSHCRYLITVMQQLEAFRSVRCHSWSDRRIYSKYLLLAFSGIYYYGKQANRSDRRTLRGELPAGAVWRAIAYTLSVKYLIAMLQLRIR